MDKTKQIQSNFWEYVETRKAMGKKDAKQVYNGYVRQISVNLLPDYCDIVAI